MKKWAAIAALMLFAVFAVCDFVSDFRANEPVRYFEDEPRRLLLVAAIAVGGGLATLVFYRISPRSQRSVKLIATGSAAVCCTFVSGYLFLGTVGLSRALGVMPGSVFLKGLAWSLGATALLWFEFYRVSKKQGA